MITKKRQTELRRLAEERRQNLYYYEPKWLRVDRQDTGKFVTRCAVTLGADPSSPKAMRRIYLTSEEFSFFEECAANAAKHDEYILPLPKQFALKDVSDIVFPNMALLHDIFHDIDALMDDYNRKHAGRHRLSVSVPTSFEELKDYLRKGIEHYIYDEQGNTLAMLSGTGKPESALAEEISKYFVEVNKIFVEMKKDHVEIIDKVDALHASTDRDTKRRARAGRKGGKRNAGRIKDDPDARNKAIEDARGHLSRHMKQEAAFTTAIEDNGLDITWQALRSHYFKKYPPKNKGGRFK